MRNLMLAAALAAVVSASGCGSSGGSSDATAISPSSPTASTAASSPAHSTPPSGTEAPPTFVEPSWPDSTYPLGRRGLPDRIYLQFHLPKNYTLPDGETGSVVITDGNPKALTLQIAPGHGSPTTCQLSVGSSCTFAGRTWRTAQIYASGSGGSAWLEAATPPPTR
jgi:hypothetical protein